MCRVIERTWGRNTWPQLIIRMPGKYMSAANIAEEIYGHS